MRVKKLFITLKTIMNYKELKKRGEKSLLWNYIGMFANRFIAFIVSIYVARILQPEDFGLIAIVTVLIGYSSQLSDIGYTSALIQRKKVYEVQYSTIFFVNLIINLIFYFAMLFFAFDIAIFFDEPKLENIIYCLSITLLINALAYIPKIKLQKEIHFKVLTQANIYKALTYGIFVTILVYNGYAIWSIVIATIASAFVSTLYIWSQVKWFPHFIFKWKSIKRLNQHGMKFWLTGLIRLFFDRIDNLILGKYFDFSVLGQYNRTVAVKGLVESISTSGLNRVLFPVFSKIDDTEVLKNTVIKVFEVISFGIFLLLGLFWLIGKDLIIFIYTEKWLFAAEMFPILILSIVITPAYLVFNNVIASMKQTSLYLQLEILNKILFVSVISIAVWFHNIYIYLYGLVLIAIIMNMVYVIYGALLLKFNISKFLGIEFKYIVQAFSISVGIKLFSHFLENGIYRFLFIVSTYIIIYIGINIILKTVGYRVFRAYIDKIFFRIKG